MKLDNKCLKAALTWCLLMMYVSFAPSAFAACNANVRATTPTIDFTVNNNGTVTHNTTGLMWKVCSEGQAWNAGDGSCSGSVTTHTWQAALQIPQTLNAGGGFASHSDWRLPNLKELTSITEFQCYDPAINTAIFNNTPPILGYWSSSPFYGVGEHSWVVFSFLGKDSYENRYEDMYVRLVRNGQ